MSQPDLPLLSRIRDIAAMWSAAGKHCYAGYVLDMAIHIAWGSGNDVLACAADSQEEFRRELSSGTATDLSRVAALRMMLNSHRVGLASGDATAVRRSLTALSEDLAQRLLDLGTKTDAEDARAGYLVRGLLLTTDFSGGWTATFPHHEVDGNAMVSGVGSLTVHVTSAFRLFTSVNDYDAAGQVAECLPDAFTSYGLQGWKAAVAGFRYPEQSRERFVEAAAHFGQDTHDDERLREIGHWSSINCTLWARYFRARAMIAELVRFPGQAPLLLPRAAAALQDTDSGWVNPQVTCFRILVTTLADLTSDDEQWVAEHAKESIARNVERYGLDVNDQLAADFLDQLTDAFTRSPNGPEHIVGHLFGALTTLGRIPLMGEDVAEALQETLGARAYREIVGIHRTWIHRSLEQITDELLLQRILLRLMQARLPLYAQVRHGPIEYGKDIVALVRAGDRFELEMYQVKAGDINKKVWSNARDELEEMFQVNISPVQLPVQPDDRRGILIFNGHFNQYAEPVAQGWRDEQRRDHNRQFTFMHLDAIVTWIVDGRLISELRSALRENGVPLLGD